MRGLRLTAGGAGLTALLSVAGVAPAAPVGPEVVDLSGAGATVALVTLAEDELDVRLREGGQDLHGSTGHDPADVVVTADQEWEIPEDSAYGFMGDPGTRMWLLSGSAGGVAWDTTGVPVAALAPGGTVEWELRSVAGPGRLTVFGGATPGMVFDSAEELPHDHALPVADRGLVTWAFDAAGEYQVTLGMRVTLLSGQEAWTETTYTVLVGESSPPSSSAPAPSSSTSVTRSPTGPSGGPSGASPSGPPVPPGRNDSPTPTVSPRQSDVDLIAQVDSVVIDVGHVDVGARLADSALQIQVKDPEEEWHDISTVVFHVRPGARTEIPDDETYAFLGRPGDPVWILPEVQEQELLWPGWNTEEIEEGDLDGGVTWRLDDVAGPGRFSLFTSGRFGDADLLLNSGDGVPDDLDIPAGTHAHGNWAFSAEGVYRLRFTMSGTLPSGQTVSDTETLAVAVGDVDPSTVVPGDGEPGDDPSPDPSSPGPDDDGNGDGDDDGPGGFLPRTGTGLLVSILVVASILLVGGVVLLLVGRRRAGGRSRPGAA